MTKEHIGIILAGGQSRRFGCPKVFAGYKNQPFYQHAIQTLTPFSIDIYMIIQNKWRDDLKNSSVSLLEDTPKFAGDGPLAGIYSAMEVTNATWYMVIPIDTPLIRPVIFEKLMEKRDEKRQAVIPFVDGRKQPLIAIYHHDTKPIIKEQLQKGDRSMKGLLDRISVQYVPFSDSDKHVFININSKEDYQKLPM
ncbi:molybdenum cofactor guanylyltransferase [Gracilibacillus sp. YIM 98692]|uniref:molybdenum cofactor guanylyltransferase n=1 Tax=Gracilibacillus sp. YIM 98692 TaxID=2663532 RepID=UPI0013D33C8A|nr:molybdenum cofactor guanylyltransferase [Gracilibacillus sp. YIM 98692]